MRCLYCGKEMALLKRLTKGGEFCSEAHKQRYQEEYDRIALSRLLQAQKKSVNAGSAPVQPPPAPTIPVAVEEPLGEQPELQVESKAEAPAEPMGFIGGPPVAVEIAADEPVSIGSVDAAEPFVEVSFVPIPAVWNAANSPKVLSSAGAVPIKVVTRESSSAERVIPTAATTEEPSCMDVRMTLPTCGAPSSPANVLPCSDVIQLSVAIKPLKAVAETTAAMGFVSRPEFQHSAMFVLPPPAIEFSIPGADVIVQAPDNNGTSGHSPIADRDTFQAPSEIDPRYPDIEPVNAEPAMPHATLEALSRLQQVMQQEPDPLQKLSELVEVATASTADPLPSEPPPAPPPPAQPVPRDAQQLVDVPLKMFAPGKRLPSTLSPVAAALPLLLPRLRALPLRPKIGLAPSDSPTKSTEPQPPSAAEPQAAPKTIETSTPVKPLQVPVKTNKQTSKAAAAQPAPASTVKKGAQPAKRRAGQTAGTVAPAQVSPVGAGSKPGTPNSAKSEHPAGADARPAATLAPVNKSERPPNVSDGALPSFGGIGRQPTASGGSLKVKIATVIFLILGAGAAYFVWGPGKAGKGAVTLPSAASDGAGPSIILGQGGWVVGWGGDSGNAASGREITIYRPSLKLSDYRIEFQGDIETKSMGWIFRASDPDNYYAMKLTLVSNGLAAKVALFKYLVVKGRQTQVGRVPIDIDVRDDTLFQVRVDVRGPKFSTYIQGQPVDVWTDDQLKTGGVGFLNERGERGRIKSVSIRYLTGPDSSTSM